MLLTLIRHGETTWNAEGRVQGQANPPLSPKGISQARELAREFKDTLKGYAAIYSSEMIRARQVAKILREGLEEEIPLILDSRLNSRNVGIFSGFSWAEIRVKYPVYYEKWVGGDMTFKPPEGESTMEMTIRTKDFLIDLKAQYPDNEKILIVSHRENIGGIILLLTGKPLDKDTLRLPNCTPFDYEFRNFYNLGPDFFSKSHPRGSW